MGVHVTKSLNTQTFQLKAEILVSKKKPNEILINITKPSLRYVIIPLSNIFFKCKENGHPVFRGNITIFAFNQKQEKRSSSTKKTAPGPTHQSKTTRLQLNSVQQTVNTKKQMKIH